MQEFILEATQNAELDATELGRFRRAVLFCEREESRRIGERRLQKYVDRRVPVFAPLAHAALSLSRYWDRDVIGAMRSCRETIALYPSTLVALWSSTLLVTLFRSLGMKREKFHAERERIHIIRQIAYHGENPFERLVALEELAKELESRDYSEDARKYAKELRTLIQTEQTSGTLDRPLLPH